MSQSLKLDRREFIGTVGVAAAIAAMPAAAALQVEPSIETLDRAALLDDWTIDDMWGVYPRPSQAIAYGKMRVAHSRDLTDPTQHLLG